MPLPIGSLRTMAHTSMIVVLLFFPLPESQFSQELSTIRGSFPRTMMQR